VPGGDRKFINSDDARSGLMTDSGDGSSSRTNQMTTILSSDRRGRGTPRSALTTLAEMRDEEPLGLTTTAAATGFTPLDDVLSGGPRPGDLLLVGGKPGIGKTVACLQWARSMARRGVTAVYVSYEHDRTTLLTRLLACELGELAIAEGRTYGRRLRDLRAQLRDVAAGTLALSVAVDNDDLLQETQRRLAEYGDRLIFVEASAVCTDVPAMIESISRYKSGRLAVFVDYLHKVPTFPDVGQEHERVGVVAQSLKELALEREISVIAIAAADEAGLAARRVHLHHFRGSSALAYEADTIIMLNDKADIVANIKGWSDPVRMEEFRRHVVFSIEKNRHGVVGVDLEFSKDFPNYRFEPQGAWVAEPLVKARYP
jgi:replicative DNA helicase